MRIEFDTGNTLDLIALSALIASLRDQAPPAIPTSPPGQSDIVEPVVVPAAAPTPAPQPDADPAAAFGGVDAATAFSGNAPAPVATSPIAAPASESAPAVPVSNGTTTSSAGQPAPTASPIDAGNAAPVAAAPSPSVGAGPASPVEVDAEGLPWDKRIHSSPPKKNKSDDKWRSKRDLDATVRATVVAELRQVMGAPAPAPVAAAPVPQPPVAEAGPAVPLPPAVAAVPAAAEPAPTTVPPAPVPTPPVADMASGPVAATTATSGPVPVATFADLMRKITGLQTAGKLTIEGTAEISRALGITGVRDLMHRPDLIPSFDALLPVAE